MLSFLTLLAAPPAAAWVHEGWGWPEADHPIPIHIHPDHEESLPEGYVPQALADAVAAWNAAPCVSAGLVLAEGDGTLGVVRDGVNSVSFNDPNDGLGTGVIAVTTTTYSNVSVFRTLGGADVYVALEADLVFNDNLDMATDEEIAAGTCQDERPSFRATATHELGHALGLGHACERGEDCDPLAEAATMNWTVGQCDSSRSTLSVDDEEGLFVLYGPEADFATVELPTCAGLAGEKAGALPFAVTCDAAGASGGSWDMGDGATVDGGSVEHTYTEAGVYAPYACLTYPTCGGFELCAEAGPLSACPELAADFDAEPLAGDALRVVNRTDAPAACINALLWTVADAAGDRITEGEDWNLSTEVPGPGVYTVTLSISGPTGSDTVTADVRVGPEPEPEDPGGRCAAAPTAPFAWLALLLLARRRR
ncbi:MAG: hypothetical protein H6739_36825 [Alphaproteobacteria bacterium]|nr:hypothetical protein [Alphaproteobacteria bacterium]